MSNRVLGKFMQDLILLASALLIIVAYMIPQLYVCAFIGYSLLVYTILFLQPTILGVTIWASIFFTFHIYPVTLVALSHGTYISFVFLTILLMYLILASVFWLYLTHTISVKAKTLPVKALIAIVSLYYYIFILDAYVFYPFSIAEGYGAFQPLVTCMHNSFFQSLVWHSGIAGATILYVSSAAVFAIVLRYKSLVGLIIFGFLGATMHMNNNESSLAPLNIATASCSFKPTNVQPWDSAHAVYQAIESIVKTEPQVDTIIFPESTCLFAMNQYPEIISFLTQAFPDKTIILGAHRAESHHLFNSLYVINNNRFITHDKTHGLIGAERAPRFFPQRSLITSGSLFSQASNAKTIKLNHQEYVPLICSELFFKTSGVDQPILCIANDAWYSGTFLPHTLAHVAKLKAAAWQRPIIYVAHNHAFIF